MVAKLVTLDDLLTYGKSIQSVTNEATSTFESTMKNVARSYGEISDWTDSQKEEFRDLASELMTELSDLYGGINASSGGLFFEKILDKSASDKVISANYSDAMASNASARYWAKNLYGENQSVESFIDGCSSFLDRKVRHASDLAIIGSANSHKKLKYARVPSGPSCGFCIMLASRGFVYANNKTAGEFSKFHDKCDCRVIPGYEGMRVEGYDYKGMYDRYKACYDTLGGEERLWQDWLKLPQEVKDTYGKGERAVVISDELKKKIGSQANAFNDYVSKRITAEMDTRSKEWLYSGKEPGYKIISGANPNTNEIDTAKRLSNNGILSVFRPTRSNENLRTSDIFIVDREWEIKSPTGNGKQTIYHQFEEASGQSDSLVIDIKRLENIENSIWTFNNVVNASKKLINYHYNDGNGGVMQFREVIIIDKNSKMIKIKRE